jgi:ubiquinol-cytochrome c reductase iron-sulfur subunit
MSQDTLVHDDDGAVDPNLPPDPSRRFWVTTACAVGGVAGVATAVPFVTSLSPSAKARAAGAPVEVDVSDIPVGTMRTVEWRGKPVWLLHRSPEQLDSLKKDDSLLADPDSKRPGFTTKYAENQYRSRKPELLVAIGICTHLGCTPTPHFETGGSGGMGASWDGGFLCPCHGSIYDLAGRVYKNKPAPDNLEIPPYQYLSDSRIIIGVDEDNKA